MTKKLTVFAFIILILGLGIAGLVFLASDSAPEPFFCNGQPCNVILIIPETLSARHMGIYGYERDTTPFIDEFFGKEGIIFENAWSTASWTLPSFVALFTSQLASKVFVETFLDKISEAIPTFIGVLEEKGIPKLVAHNTAFPFVAPADWGFTTHLKTEERFRGEDPFLFLKAVEWIEAQSQKKEGEPFFLLLQPFAPHSPYDPPEACRYLFDAPSEYPGPVTFEELLEVKQSLRAGEEVKAEKIERFRLQYDQEIRYLDSQIEAFITRIPEEVLRNTIFIFTSDHGEAFGQHNDLAHAGVYYEEVIHVPFLIRVPGLEPRRVQEPITLLDVGPTILDVFNLEIPDTFQGVSILPLLRGEELHLKDRIVRAEHILFKTAFPLDFSRLESQVRTGPIILTEESIKKWGLTVAERFVAVRKGEWKLIKGGECYVRNIPATLELYNLERDYYEQDNLILRWHDLPEKDQVEIIPLFEALGENYSRE